MYAPFLPVGYLGSVELHVGDLTFLAELHRVDVLIRDLVHCQPTFELQTEKGDGFAFIVDGDKLLLLSFEV